MEDQQRLPMELYVARLPPTWDEAELRSVHSKAGGDDDSLQRIRWLPAKFGEKRSVILHFCTHSAAGTSLNVLEGRNVRVGGAEWTLTASFAQPLRWQRNGGAAWNDGQTTGDAWKDPFGGGGGDANAVAVDCGMRVRNRRTWRAGEVLRVCVGGDAQWMQVRFDDGEQALKEISHFEMEAGGLPLAAAAAIDRGASKQPVVPKVGIRVRNWQTWRPGVITAVYPGTGRIRVLFDEGDEGQLEASRFETEAGGSPIESPQYAVTPQDRPRSGMEQLAPALRGRPGPRRGGGRSAAGDSSGSPWQSWQHQQQQQQQQQPSNLYIADAPAAWRDEDLKGAHPMPASIAGIKWLPRRQGAPQSQACCAVIIRHTSHAAAAAALEALRAGIETPTGHRGLEVRYADPPRKLRGDTDLGQEAPFKDRRRHSTAESTTATAATMASAGAGPPPVFKFKRLSREDEDSTYTVHIGDTSDPNFCTESTLLRGLCEALIGADGKAASVQVDVVEKTPVGAPILRITRTRDGQTEVIASSEEPGRSFGPAEIAARLRMRLAAQEQASPKVSEPPAAAAVAPAAPVAGKASWVGTAMETAGPQAAVAG